MKQVITYVLCFFTVVAILSAGPAAEYKRDPGLKPYYKILMYAKDLPEPTRKLVDSFIIVDQATNMRTSYIQTIKKIHSK